VALIGGFASMQALEYARNRAFDPIARVAV
jgi:hypothetical protein